MEKSLNELKNRDKALTVKINDVLKQLHGLTYSDAKLVLEEVIGAVNKTSGSQIFHIEKPHTFTSNEYRLKKILNGDSEPEKIVDLRR